MNKVVLCHLLLQATKPVQEYLDMPFDEIREQHKTATFLPRPLYVLYMQASAYRDACGKFYYHGIFHLALIELYSHILVRGFCHHKNVFDCFV